jgi:hypothetical protein
VYQYLSVRMDELLSLENLYPLHGQYLVDLTVCSAVVPIYSEL